MIAARNWGDDEQLLADIAEAVRPGPHEQEVLEAGRLVWAFHGADADRELAALLHDSHVDGPVAVRGPAPGAPRSLVFALGGTRVEIELSEAGIEGQLVPPEPGTVRLLDASGPVAEATADEVGCFAFPPARHGPIRLECEVGGRRLATEWITQ